jgi:hypothetical protein
MRRLLFTLTWVALTLGVLAAPGRAKGITDHAKVTVEGAGLPGGIITLGADGGAFVAGSGVWDVKWDAPNVGGSLEPNLPLGPAFDVRVVLRCDGGGRSRYDQTLYPNAPGGPQLFTPAGVEVCGDAVPSGYDGIGETIEQLLGDHGIAFRPLPTEAATAGPEDGPSTSTPALAAIAVPFALALVAGEEIVRRRRRRR